MANTTRWIVLDADGRPVKNQPRKGWGSYEEADTFALKHALAGFTIEVM